MSQQQQSKYVNCLEIANEEIYNQGERNTIKYMKTKEMIFFYFSHRIDNRKTDKELNLESYSKMEELEIFQIMNEIGIMEIEFHSFHKPNTLSL